MSNSFALVLLVSVFSVSQAMPVGESTNRSGITQFPMLATHYLDRKEIYEGHLGEGIKLYKGDDEEYDEELYRSVR